MNKPKFTKGEWYIDSSDEFFDGAKVTSDERYGMVCVCEVRGAYFDDEEMNDFELEQQANAHLIAAAPKMYVMLDDLCNYLFALDSIEATHKARQIEKLLAEARGDK